MGEARRAHVGDIRGSLGGDPQSYDLSVSAETALKLGGPASYGSFGVEKRLEKIDEMLDLRGKRVLDLGCGNGCYTAELARRAASVCGVDLQRQHLKVFRQPIHACKRRGEFTLRFREL